MYHLIVYLIDTIKYTLQKSFNLSAEPFYLILYFFNTKNYGSVLFLLIKYYYQFFNYVNL
jgi:hypothetical protein